MNENFVILVADRNRHVREFLKREFSAEGYCIVVAKDGYEVLNHLGGAVPPDLLILDLEIPYAGSQTMLERLKDLKRPLPIVIHTFPSEYGTGSGIDAILSTGTEDLSFVAAVVEKSGNTDRLRTVVMEVLQRYYPGRCGELKEPLGKGVDV
jgi:CheY-like chemotaxis protein